MNLPVSPCFATDYRSARTRFLDGARARNAAVESHVLQGHAGANGEALAMDVALLGDASSDHMLVVTSGLHGVEGFCGSGCQVAMLHDGLQEERLRDSGVALLLVHAVNPWGFSHLRRVNKDGIDLNRNFLDHEAGATSDPDFARLHPLLVPQQWPPGRDIREALDGYIHRNGVRKFQQVLMRGQSTHAAGLFYAGIRPAWSNIVLRDVLQRFGRSRRQLAWIDLHTGLGPVGYGEKIYVGVESPDGLARARATWGTDVVHLAHGDSVSEEVRGHAAGCLHEVFPGAAGQALALEFGTVPFMRIVEAMRADQWLTNHAPDAPSQLRHEIKQALRDAFYVDSDEWRAMVVAQARVAVLQALKSLAST